MINVNSYLQKLRVIGAKINQVGTENNIGVIESIGLLGVYQQIKL